MNRDLASVVRSLFSLVGESLLENPEEYKQLLSENLEEYKKPDTMSYEQRLIVVNLCHELRINTYLSLIGVWLKNKKFLSLMEYEALAEQIIPLCELVEKDGKYYNAKGEVAPNYIQTKAQKYKELYPLPKRLSTLEEDYKVNHTMDTLFAQLIAYLCENKPVAGQLLAYKPSEVVEQMFTNAEHIAQTVINAA